MAPCVPTPSHTLRLVTYRTTAHRRCLGHASAFKESEESKGARPIVAYRPKPRTVGPPPVEVPVVHSSAFITSNGSKLLIEKEGVEVVADSDRKGDLGRGTSGEDVSGNALEWALKRADAHFDKIEANSTNGTSRLLVQNPATQATLRAMQGVTAVGAAAAPQILRAAVPIGKQLLSASATLFISGIGALNDAAAASRKRKRDREVEETSRK